jgi:hypothetical protein
VGVGHCGVSPFQVCFTLEGVAGSQVTREGDVLDGREEASHQG